MKFFYSAEYEKLMSEGGTGDHFYIRWDDVHHFRINFLEFSIFLAEACEMVFCHRFKWTNLMWCTFNGPCCWALCCSSDFGLQDAFQLHSSGTPRDVIQTRWYFLDYRHALWWSCRFMAGVTYRAYTAAWVEKRRYSKPQPVSCFFFNPFDCGVRNHN